MRWDRFFDDLELQLSSEWEAERAALDTEAERLRLSRVGLRERLAHLTSEAAEAASFELSDGTVMRATVGGVGADCVALSPVEGRAATVIAPLGALVGVTPARQDLLHSAQPAPAGTARGRSALSEHLTLGFVLRDLVRRRAGVAVHLATGRTLPGTIDRAGSDHLDLAVHDPGAPRRSAAVTGYRLIPFAAISWVRIAHGSSVL